ncbi:MAG: hypothetical protein HGA76_00555, partial [Candidatus Firestonebacteria bacterium]|nr:hypothetical protein [Candidatus Firestonebacteria bacterium]
MRRWLAFLAVVSGAFFFAAVAQAIPDMNSSSGYYYDNFDSTQGVGTSSQVQINTTWHGVTLTAGQTTGWFTSTTITPASLQGWLQLETQLSQPAGTALTVDVLDANLNVVQSFSATGGAAAHLETFDISGVNVLTYPNLILRANFSAPSGSPILFSWRLKWLPKPDVFVQLQTVSDSDPQGVTVVAGTQLLYTLAYNINNVSAHNVVVSTTLTAKDGYGTEMINYSAGSASPAPNSITGRFMYWNLGNIGAGVNGNITFKVDVPNGATCSWNTATHGGGMPITLTAKFQSLETGFQGVISSPTGNALVGSGGAPTYTYVSSSSLDSIELVRPQYAIPGRDYTYIYRIQNVSHVCPKPWSADEIMHNVTITCQVPAGSTYVSSGLYNSPLAGNGPFASGTDGSGKVVWTIGKLDIHSCWDCTYTKGVYLYVTVNLPILSVPGTLTIPAATLFSDQSTTRTAAASTATLVDESTVDANPNSYVSFSMDTWGAVASCDTIYPYRYIINSVNKPLRGAYVVEPVPAAATLQYWDRYCYPSSMNGNMSPLGNTIPVYYSTTVTAANLPDPPNLASGIWYPTNTAQSRGRITHTLVNLGNINYTLRNGSHDGMYRQYYIIDGNVPTGTTIPMVAWLYANTSTPNARRLATNTVNLTVTDSFTPSFGFYGFTNDKDPIEAGDTTRIRYNGYGHVNNSYIYTILPPELEYNPVGTTTQFNMRKNNCAGDHPCILEYSTTLGLYPFDRNTAEHAAWSRVLPTDTTKITGIRWAMGDWWYYWGGGPWFDFYLSVRAKLGLPNHTVATIKAYGVYDGLGTSPVPNWSITTNITSHVQLAISKVVDKSLLPASRVQYYLNYANTGNMNETSATLWDKVPAYTEFMEAKGPAGSSILYSSNPSASLPSSPADWSATTLGASTTWVKWQVPGVPAGQLLAVTLTTKPVAGLALGAVIANTGYIVGANSSTLTSNTVTILNAPDFSDVSTTNLGVDPEGDVKAGTLMHYVLTYY